LLIFLLFISQSQFWVIYASEIQKLDTQKDVSTQQLELVWDVIETAVWKLDTKIRDEDKSQKLQEKWQEIEQYIQDAQQQIQQEISTKDIQEKVEEVKKVVVLKVVSGVTEYESVEKNISQEVASTQKQKQDALETIQDSLQDENGDYSLIVKTKYKWVKLTSILRRFDENIKIDFMYSWEGQNYFEVFLSPNSIFRREMLEDIELGILPESFIGIDIILPEVYGISQVLDGENTNLTWGIEQYKSYDFIEAYKTVSRNITVGVVDTGIDYNHPDLKENVNTKLWKDFVNNDDDAWDDQWHGTHVAGTIAAGNNGNGIIGVNPYVTLVPLKICTNKGFCPSYAVLRALEYAKESRIDILNMSLWGRWNPEGHPICQGIDSVAQAGGIVVAASGNSNINTSRFVPGGCGSAITVWAIDSQGNRAPFSNYGAKVDLAAPGVDVYSSYPGGWYKKLSWTSMATPHIVGLVSLLRARDSQISSRQARDLLKKYPLSVNLDRADKTIWSHIDIQKLFISLESAQDEKVKPEENQEQQQKTITNAHEEVVQEKQEEGSHLIEGELELVLTAQKDENINISQSWNAQEQEKDVEIQEDVSVTDIDSRRIKFWESGIEINSLSGEDIISESISPEIIELDAQKDIQESQTFDTDGKQISEGVEINASELMTSQSWEILPEDFDIHNLPIYTNQVWDSESKILISPEPELEALEIFVDGAESWVEINSSDDTFESIQIWEFSELWEWVFLDDDGNAFDISQFEQFDSKVEILDYTYDEEVFVDGAEGWVEINSQDPEVEQVISDFDPENIVFNTEVFTPSQLYDVSDVSTENLPAIWDQDFIELEPVQEIIDTPEITPEEIFVDGAGAWVEINSLSAEQELDEITQEYSPELDIIQSENIDEIEIIWVAELESIEENGVEINSNETQEALEIIPEVESIPTPDQSDIDFDEIEIDMPEDFESSWVEINNFWDDQREEIELDIVSHEQALDISQLDPINAGEIETPEEFKDFWGEDELWEDEYIEIQAQEYREADELGQWEDTFQDWFSASIQNTYHCTVELWQKCELRIYKSYRYQFHESDPGLVSYRAWKRKIYISGNKVWTNELKLYMYGRHYHTVYITVKKPVPPKEYDLNIRLWSTGKIYFPSAYAYDFRASSRNIRVYGDRRYIQVSASQAQNDIIYVYRFWRVVWIIHVHVAVPVHKKTLEVGQNLPVYLNQAYRYNFSTSDNSKVTISANSRYIYVFWKSAGNVQVYVKYWNRHIYTLDITIPEPPTPKEYSVTLQEWWDTRLYFPDHINYGFYTENLDTWRAQASRNRNMFYMRSYTPGKIRYHVKNSRNQTIYLVHLTILPKPPVDIHLETYVWRYIYASIPQAQYHQFSSSNSRISQKYISRYGINFRGLQVGENQIYVKRNWIHKYTIHLKIKEIPKPKTYNITVVESQTTQVHFPSSSSYYSYYRTYSNGWSAYVYAKSNFANIRWYWIGKVHFSLYDRYGIHLYNLHVEVKPKPPEIRTASMYEGRQIRLPNMNFDTKISYSQAWIVSAYRSTWYNMAAVWLQEWEVEVYFKNGKGKHFLTYKITVLPTPKPKQVIKKDIFVRQWLYIQLPWDLNQYRYTYSWDGRVSDQRIYSWNRMYMRGYSAGRFILHYKWQNGFDVYRIEINIKLQEQYITAHLTERVRTSVHSQDRFTYSVPNVAYVRSSPDQVHWLALGETDIDVRDKNGVLYKRLYVKVIPKPDPKQLSCETRIGYTCRYKIWNAGYYYTESRSGIADIDTGKTSFRIKWKSQGTIKLYIKAKYANYISHIITVNVLPEPVREYDCVMPVGTECETYWSWEKYKYTYKISKSGIADMSLAYYRSGTKRMNKLRLIGRSQGSVKVYVYDSWRHVATFNITVDPAVPRIQIWKRESTIKQGETFTWIIEAGGWDYKSNKLHDTDILSFRVWGKDWEQVWDFSYTGNNPGRTSVGITDKYWQTLKFWVTVLPAKLRLSHDYISFQHSQYEYISISESYKGLKSIKIQDPSIASAYYVTLKDGNRVIRVNKKSPWVTYLQAQDYLDNMFVVKIEVWGSKKEESDWNGDSDWWDQNNTDKNYEDLDSILQKIIYLLNSQSGTTIQNNDYKLSQENKNKIDAVLQKYINTKWEKAARDLILGFPYIKKKYDSSTWFILDYISESIQKQLDFRVIYSVTDITNWNIWWIQFQVSPNLQWSISNIWVQYLDWNWLQKKKELKLQTDGQYIVAFSEDSCKWCMNLEPYYLLSGRTDIIIANINDSIFTNSSWINQFVKSLRLIFNWKRYSEEWINNSINEDLTDIKETTNMIKSKVEKGSKDISINLVLQAIALEASWGIDTKYINTKKLPVAWYMLDKFLNWPRGDDFYDTDNWISEKLFNSNEYKEILDEVSNNFNSSMVDEWEKILIKSSSKRFPRVFTSLKKLDLYMAIASFDYSISIFKKNWELYSQVEFSDEYDFEPNNYWEWISETLNYWWNYHEKNLTWQPYKWKSIIIKPF